MPNTTNIRICGCGDCESATQRATKLCVDMYENMECPQYQFAVATAMQAIAFASMRERTLAHRPDLRNPLGELALDAEMLRYTEMVKNHLIDHGEVMFRDIMLNILHALGVFESRITEERQRQKDNTTFDVDLSDLLKRVAPKKGD